MTDTIRERAIDAFMSALTGTEGVSTRIYRTRTAAFRREDIPALNVIIGPCRKIDENIVNIFWGQTVSVKCYVRGDIPDAVSDPTVKDLYARIMADRTLGGIVSDISPLGDSPAFEEGDGSLALIIVSFEIQFFTNASDLTV